MRNLRWWVGGMGAVALLAFTVLFLSDGDGGSNRGLASTVTEVRPSAGVASTDSIQSTDNSGSTVAAVSETGSGEVAESDSVVVSDGESAAEDAGAGGDVTAEPVPVSKQPAVKSGPLNGLRLRIPSLGVDALVIELGTNETGQLDVPRDAYSVGWYSISTRPGENGNALLGGHLNWAGLRGVFDRLDELSDGDLIYLVEDGEEMVFEVSRSRSVPADASLQEVLQAPAAGSTLTLFTCDGTFDRGAGEYEHRLVVNARRVVSGAG